MRTADVQIQEIDGVTYHVLPLPGGASLMVAAKLMKMAAPAFSDVPALLEAAQKAQSALEALASGLVADLDADVILFCARQFAAVTQFEVGGAKLPMVSDKGDLFDEHFRGRFMAMLRWLAFCGRVTFPFVAKPRAAAPVAAPAAG